MASWSTLYTRSPTRSSAIGRSPVGVAMGVSGDAHTRMQLKSFLYSHFQAPFSQVTLRPHESVRQALPDGRSHAAPWFGMTPGQSSLPTGAGVQPQTFDPCGSLPQYTLQPGSLQHGPQKQEAVW